MHQSHGVFILYTSNIYNDAANEIQLAFQNRSMIRTSLNMPVCLRANDTLRQ